MWFALSLALADPPEGVDRDDTDKWSAMSDAALDGPPGCWDFSGELLITVSFLSKASFWRRTTATPTVYHGTWKGTLDDGTWTSFRYALDDPESDDDWSIYPVVGEIEPSTVVKEGAEPKPEPDPEATEDEKKSRGISVSIGKGDEDGDSEGESAERGAVNLVRRSLEVWDTSTATSVSQWREDTREIELIQDSPIKDKVNAPTITLTTRIPEGEWVSRFSAEFPKKIVLGEWPITATLHDMQFHLVQRNVGGHVFPSAENVSAVATALGFTLSYEQRLDYRSAAACAAPSLDGAP